MAHVPERQQILKHVMAQREKALRELSTAERKAFSRGDWAEVARCRMERDRLLGKAFTGTQ